MLKYLYIPEEKDLDDYIEYAINNKFNQIIHGDSDIIKSLIKDKKEIEEVLIPEFRGIANDLLVYEEESVFKIIWIDEFFKNHKDSEIIINIFRLDDEDFNKKDYLLSSKFDVVSRYIYQVEVSINNYGEYPFEIIIKDDDDEKIIARDSIIIYKKYNEEDSDDKFFFPG